MWNTVLIIDYAMMVLFFPLWCIYVSNKIAQHPLNVSERDKRKENFKILFLSKRVWVAFACIVIFPFLKAGYAANPPEFIEPQLDIFSAEVYREELKAIVRENDLDVEEQELEKLLAKFSKATNAFRRQDYKESLNHLEDIKNGVHLGGRLVGIDSRVLYNNLGCIYYLVHKNEGFNAIYYLKFAESMSNIDSRVAQRIEDNLESLEKAHSRFIIDNGLLR